MISRDHPIVLYPSGTNWIAKWVGGKEEYLAPGDTPWECVMALLEFDDVVESMPHATATLTCSHCGHTAVHAWPCSIGLGCLECGVCGAFVPTPEVGGAKLGDD